MDKTRAAARHELMRESRAEHDERIDWADEIESELRAAAAAGTQ